MLIIAILIAIIIVTDVKIEILNSIDARFLESLDHKHAYSKIRPKH